MTKPNFRSVVLNINRLAKTHELGRLPEMRKQLKGKRQLPQSVFTQSTTFDRYAFHHGGRKELQFNVGIDRPDDVDELRYGVAFSLETNQSLPKIEPLIPKIRLFNDFISLYPEEYVDMSMWHYVGSERSKDYPPTPITPALVAEGVFIFLGKRQQLDHLDYNILFHDIDRLIPLYRYVEGKGNLAPVLGHDKFIFRPGFARKAATAVVTQTEKELDVTLRHNALQEQLWRRLAQKHGTGNVSAEQLSGAGTRIDVVVQNGGEFWYYEIKTDYSPRACLRQAIGQLLEYAFWPGTQGATRLVVVGENALDKEGETYLLALRKQFRLPVFYEQADSRATK